VSGANRDRSWLRTILIGDARVRLAELPSASVDCVITSPPYFALRNYGHDQQIGAERDVDGWVDQLRQVTRAVARVLKPSGVLWLNLGDGYSRHPAEGAPQKSLLLAPQRLALALVADGWILRNEVIWAKTNPMPSSVRDRLTSTHEVLYLFTRSRHYFFDLDTIRVPHLTSHQTRQPQAAGRTYPPASAAAMLGKVSRTNPNGGLGRMKAGGIVGHPLGKNPGDVWHLATAGYRAAHFATFPVFLVERPLLATCPAQVCATCGTPWRSDERSRHRSLTDPAEPRPGCSCQAPSRPGVVLDPFLGAGTVAVAAERHGRDWVGIELSPAYAALAEERIREARAKRRERTADTGQGWRLPDQRAA